MTKIAGSGSISQRHGSADADPHQNVMDPEHWVPELHIEPLRPGKRSTTFRRCTSNGRDHMFELQLGRSEQCM
jgi:hypothetical protein